MKLKSRTLTLLAALATLTASTLAPAGAGNPNRTPPEQYAIYCDPYNTGNVQAYFEPTGKMPLYLHVDDYCGFAGDYIGGGIPFNGNVTPVQADYVRLIANDVGNTDYYYSLFVSYIAPDGTTGGVYANSDPIVKQKDGTQAFNFDLVANGVPVGSRLNYLQFIVYEYDYNVPVTVLVQNVTVSKRRNMIGKDLNNSYPYCSFGGTTSGAASTSTESTQSSSTSHFRSMHKQLATP